MEEIQNSRHEAERSVPQNQGLREQTPNPSEQVVQESAPQESAPQEIAPQEAPVEQPVQEEQIQEQPTDGPRIMSFFTLVLKTFAGFGGGIAGTVVLLVIFLAASSILQPVIGVAEAISPEEISPLFVVVLIVMVFATTVISSMIGPLLLSYTERDRYTRISTTMGQIFIMNIVIFAFVLPVYLTTSSTNLELTAYAAGLQVILSAIASALTLELLHDPKYPLLAVYNTVLAILASTAVCFLIYFIIGNPTILLFIALPIIWGFIGFFQAVVAMFYYWVFQTWGKDYLATETAIGTDYGIPDTSEEEEELAPDVEGSDFLNQ